MIYWTGKSAIVTGAGSGIGRALAIELAARGTTVWLSDIDSDAVEQSRQLIPTSAHAVTLDVADADAVQAHVNDVARTHGRLDFIFNNAGIGVGGDFREMSRKHFERCIDVNIRGVVNGVLAAYPLMVKQGGGHIVSTASAAGLLGVPLMAPYCMTKHAVVGLTTSLRTEAAWHGVRVSALCPTAVETPLLDRRTSIELGAKWQPDARKYLTKVGGAPYPVDKFVRYCLRQIERNRGIIIAPFGARVRLGLARVFPRAAEWFSGRALREVLAERPPQD